MKTALFAAAAVIALSSTAAFAGEGNGNPFPFQAPGVVTATTGHVKLSSGGLDPYTFRANGTLETTATSNLLLSSNTAEGTVQSINALPRGAANGTLAYDEQAAMNKYVVAHLAAPSSVGGATASRG